MKHLHINPLRWILVLGFILCIGGCYSQTKFTGYAYILSSDEYIAIKYTRSVMSFEDTLSTINGLISDNVIKIKSRKEKLNKINERYI
jgi:hypothetical protein